MAKYQHMQVSDGITALVPLIPLPFLLRVRRAGPSPTTERFASPARLPDADQSKMGEVGWLTRDTRATALEEQRGDAG